MFNVCRVLFLRTCRDEDHTLGNALRHVLMQNKEVDFCGYSVPHPSEPKMNLRLQTTGDLRGEVVTGVK